MSSGSRRREGVDWHESFASGLGKVLLVAGFVSLISLPLRRVRLADRIDDAFSLVNVPVGASLFSAVLLFVIAGAVRRRMRSALWVLLGLQVATAIYLVVVGVVLAAGTRHKHHIAPISSVYFALNVVSTVALLWLLWVSRASFTTRLQDGSRVRALVILVIGLTASTVTSILLVLAFPGHLSSGGRRIVWAVRVAFGLEPDAADVGWRGQHGHHWIAAIAGLISAAALVLAVLTFLRSARVKAYLGPDDELTLRGLLLRHGSRDSLGYFATRRDKSVAYSPDRTAAVTYRVVANVSLASADPIGAEASWDTAIRTWLTEARAFGWFPAVLSASEEGARAYVKAGLRALPIGDEAIIDVDDFSLDGPAMQPVRRAARRIQRAGYTITVHRHGDLSPAQLTEIEQRAEDWRGEDTERGFSMSLGRIGDPTDGVCVAVLAHDSEGVLRGLLSFVPWGPRGLSLDLMRRDRSSENGLIEAMVAALITSSRASLGVDQVSLNFAMFRGVFSAAERVGAGPLVRSTSRLLSFASKFWQIETLYRSNARYRPRWVPRYLCYDSNLTLTRVALASGIAEGFLPELPGSSARLAAEFEASADYAQRVEAQRRAFVEPVLAPRLNDQQRARHRKLEVLRTAGIEPYPVRVTRDTDIADLTFEFAGLAPGTHTGRLVSVVGRVRSLRDFGGLTFLGLQEGSHFVQAMADRRLLDARRHDLLRSCVDLGDHVAVTGEVITSARGELSVLIDEWTMAAKSLRPLPGSRSGFANAEARLRQRHLDLIVNPESAELINKRSVAVREVREAFARRGFVEVETPMLQSVHGGANARPFVTHINAYDAKLYLRIAPELHLKRLCVGGMRRVFELNRNFRNEGADSTHNPEFTSVEAYQAYSDYLDMRDLTRELIIEVATAVHGSPIARRIGPDGSSVDVDLSGEWPSITVHDAVSDAFDTVITPDTGLDELLAVCREFEIVVPTDATPASIVGKLYDEVVEPRTTRPTFYLDFPIETSPLARRHRRDPRLAEQWDLVAFGTEIGTAYSELIDPVDQRARLTEQSLLAAAGDREAMQIDEAFLAALETAMPPTGGLGIGIDRLVMLLTGVGIRQTLTFPFVRPRDGA